MMNKPNILILSALLLSSCFFRPERKAENIAIEEHYSLDIPTEFIPQYDMHDFAGLQFAHKVEPIYLLGLTEPKKELRKLHLRFSLDEYAYFATRNLGEGFPYHYVTDTASGELNGNPVHVTYLETMSCKGQEATDLAYELAIIDAGDYYCQLIGWAPKSEAEQLHTEMAPLIASFQDITRPEDSELDPNAMGSPAGARETGE